MDKKENPCVAIILLNWNGFEDTSECIKSLLQLSYNNYKVVVVDNKSDNEEGKRLKEYFPQIHLIQNEINRGFAGGNNDGIKWAKDNNFDLVWILNNDTVVDKDSLLFQVKHFDNKNVGCVGPKIKYYNSNKIWARGVHLLKLSLRPLRIYFFSNIGEGEDDNTKEENCDLQYISGCSIIMRNTIENIFFDEDFFAYCEDMELCHRIRQERYRLIYEPKSIVYHKGSQASGGQKLNKRTAYFSYRNKIIFLRKTCPFYKSILISPFYLACYLRDLTRIVLKYQEKRILAQALWNGFVDGIANDLSNRKGY